MDDFYNPPEQNKSVYEHESSKAGSFTKSFLITLGILLILGLLGYLAFWYYNQTTQKFSSNEMRLQQLEDESKISDKDY